MEAKPDTVKLIHLIVTYNFIQQNESLDINFLDRIMPVLYFIILVNRDGVEIT